MNINRHNYETFFLLYVDNELSATDKKAVDVFVQENPDLLMELQLLQQTVVKADDIVLDKKDWLYMETGISKLQEELLLYADDELTAADRNSVEQLIKTDSAACREWAILKQTKFQPDLSLLHPDKKLLYKKETARVVSIKWWRVAAAAVLLGFGIWTGISLLNNSNTGGPNDLAGESVQNESSNSVSSLQSEVITASPSNAQLPVTTETLANQEVKKNEVNEVAASRVKSPLQKKVVTDPAPGKDMATVQKPVNKKPDNNLPKSYLDNINNHGSNESVVTTVIPENNKSNVVSGNLKATLKTRPDENVEFDVTNRANTSVAAVSTVNSSSNADVNSRYVNLEDDDNKRTALGGFLRKAKRVLERTTNINTGEGVKIAGFEIALK